MLPGIPAFALPAAQCFPPSREASSNRVLFRISAGMLMMFFLAFLLVSLGYGITDKRQKDIVNAFYENRRDPNSHLVYLFKRPFSARFYTRETSEVIASPGDMAYFFINGVIDYFAARPDRIKKIPASFLDNLVDMGRINRYHLLKGKPCKSGLEQRGFVYYKSTDAWPSI